MKNKKLKVGLEIIRSMIYSFIIFRVISLFLNLYYYIYDIHKLFLFIKLFFLTMFKYLEIESYY